MPKKIPIVTESGITYETTQSACQAHGISQASYCYRRRIGFTVDEALGIVTPRPRHQAAGPEEIHAALLAKAQNTHTGFVEADTRDTPIRLKDGSSYPSLKEAASARGIPIKTIYYRTRRDWSIDQAFELEPSPPSRMSQGPIDIKTADGKQYRSILAACKANGISRSLLDQRRMSGWSLDEALGLLPRKKHLIQRHRFARFAPKPVIIAGQFYASLEAGCKELGLSFACVHSRLTMGWSLKEALGIEPREMALKSDRKGSKRKDIVWISGVAFSLKDGKRLSAAEEAALS